jgi:hypothetical protein
MLGRSDLATSDRPSAKAGTSAYGLLRKRTPLRNACERVHLGAKLGAILCGRVWTAVDACGQGGLPLRAVWTAVDGCGHGL